MLHLKKRIPIYIIIFLLLISGIYLIQHPSIISNIFLIDSRATQQSISMSITITGCAEEEINTTTGESNFTDICNQPIIPKITGLPNSTIKLQVFTNLTTPTGFTAPSATDVTTVLNYINITFNTTLTGTATIFFNISDAALGSIPPVNISLFKYTSSWINLSTTVLDTFQDPNSFSATTTSFSRFLIGEKAEAAAVTPPTTPVGGGAASKGAFVYIGEKPTEPPKRPTVKLPEVVKKILKKIAEIPRALLRYKISYKIIYITAIALLSLVIILEITYYLIRNKK